MRHHNQNRKLSRVRKTRKALLNSLARSLILHEKIKTTEAKAKELRPFVEKLVTKSKMQTVTARRAAIGKIGKVAAKKLFGDISKKYENRKGGYSRITKIQGRLSDGSKMAIIEFV
jgi:large subunit ribosomal protein L17